MCEWKKLKSVNVSQSYEQERGCLTHFACLANTLLKDEERARYNRVLACNCAKYSPIEIFFTHRLSNEWFNGLFCLHYILSLPINDGKSKTKRLAQTVYFTNRFHATVLTRDRQRSTAKKTKKKWLASHANGLNILLGSQPLARSHIGYIDVACVLPIVLPKNSL